MAFDEIMASRAREIIFKTHSITEEKKMFGGLCFMVAGKMCVGIMQDRLMIRLNPAIYDEAIEREGCNPMDFTGKSMRGFVFVDGAELTTHKKLNDWIQLALDYNALAKASKKKK
jgi:TfoX/Sxy family transcriptional regulator of competence genes